MTDTEAPQRRAALLALGAALVLTAAFLAGRATATEPTASPPNTIAAPETAVSTPATDPRTGRSNEPTESELLRADYVPTTNADASPKERTRVEIETTVRGFVRAWSMRGTVDERRAALEPYVSTPVMIDAFALADPDDVPQGGLSAPPAIGGIGDDYAQAFIIFVDSTTATVQVVKLDTGWRVYQVDGA